MKNYISGSIAVVIAIGLISFTKPKTIEVHGKKFTTAVRCYIFVGSQNKTERQKATNYVNPTASTPTCVGTGNECAVCVTVTLDAATGLAPENPDFTGATFSASGMPVAGTGLIVSNLQKT